MNIRAISGKRLIYKYPKNASDFDRTLAKMYLKLNSIYNAEWIYFYEDGMSYVYLKEFKDIGFCSKMFEFKENNL